MSTSIPSKYSSLEFTVTVISLFPSSSSNVISTAANASVEKREELPKKVRHQKDSF
jgi:hypothetical protein